MFAREVRFDVDPLPFRVAQNSALEGLKERLLRQLLEYVTDPELNALLRRAANEAAALVWLTPCPTLLFPELLEEKLRNAVEQRRRQARIRRRSRNLLLNAA